MGFWGCGVMVIAQHEVVDQHEDDIVQDFVDHSSQLVQEN